MHKKHKVIAALAMPLAFTAQAQNVGEEAADAAGLAPSESQLSEAELPEMSDALVPSLADVLSEMDEVEILQMEQTVTDTGTLDLDTDMVVENQITADLEEGLISPENASDVEVVMEIVNANAEYFNFDILQEISDLIAEGEFSETQIRQTLEAFDSLSDADKAIVAQEEFDAQDPGNALYQQVSAEGRAIIQANMPVLTE